ncbi:serine hydrolase domain-containing protein [Kitasatospora sp. GP82]|uniref:serine hydrolase domain-containing protein n=1 Tax=Kitasatospora sp. GP82 TaxID=3035089 RepID=UPI00247624DB|nr:serine hydrolase domain-containing protein [Kitasatospora sp. GP82]MDH6128017.1 D-alanyl-D-alanine carboxypeptidase [Kitasatospora sp. GP82]
MNPIASRTRASRTRWTTVAAAGALLVALVTGAAAPASAAPVAAPGAGAVAAPLPPLDPAALRQAIDGLPNADVTGALVRVTGSAGDWSGTSGVGDLTTRQPVPQDGHFRIGSISKVFTATVVLQLAAERRIDLDGTVQQYLPGVLPADLPPIKVGQLLDHTSGLPRGDSSGFGDGSPEWFAAHRLDSWTPRQVVAALAGQPMQFAPGTAQQYNGMNTFVAGLLVEKITGRSFAQEVQSRIARPLGLKDTYVPDAKDPRLPGPHSHGYLTVKAPDGSTHPVDVSQQSPWPWAEGGMISTAGDLDHFIGALFRGRLLPPAQEAELFTVPDVPNFDNSHCQTPAGPGRACLSMGLMRVKSANGIVVWGKTGSRPGYISGVFATRDLSRRIVYSLNPTNLNGTESRYVQRIATAALGGAPTAG